MRESQEFTMSRAERAVHLRRIGLSPLPLNPTEVGIQGNEKISAIFWKPLQKLPESVANIPRWFAGPYEKRNIGAITGESGKIIVVDSDNEAAVAYALKNLPPTPMQVITAKGRHFYYAHPGVVVRNGVKLKGMALDVRGDGGYVVVPDSVHWTGHIYRWVEEPSAEMIASLPKFDPAWIASEKREFRRRSAFLPNDKVDPETRASHFVAGYGPAISGQGGHNQTFNLACILVHPMPDGFGISSDQALKLMRVWNARCEPPWSESDLAHKIEDAVLAIGSQRGRIQKTIGG